jgi:prepilin-type N-terminal cleavage/methylation domain-containing protein
MVQGLLAHRKDEDGFTLIELLIVIVVLAILAAIVVFAIGTTRTDAVTSSCISNVKQIVTSAEAVFTKTGAYPAQVGLVAGATSPGALLREWPASADYTLTFTGGATDFSLVIAGTGTTLHGGSVTSVTPQTTIATDCAA